MSKIAKVVRVKKDPGEKRCYTLPTRVGVTISAAVLPRPIAPRDPGGTGLVGRDPVGRRAIRMLRAVRRSQMERHRHSIGVQQGEIAHPAEPQSSGTIVTRAPHAHLGLQLAGRPPASADIAGRDIQPAHAAAGEPAGLPGVLLCPEGIVSSEVKQSLADGPCRLTCRQGALGVEFVRGVGTPSRRVARVMRPLVAVVARQGTTAQTHAGLASRGRGAGVSVIARRAISGRRCSASASSRVANRDLARVGRNGTIGPRAGQTLPLDAGVRLLTRRIAGTGVAVVARDPCHHIHHRARTRCRVALGGLANVRGLGAGNAQTPVGANPSDASADGAQRSVGLGRDGAHPGLRVACADAVALVGCGAGDTDAEVRTDTTAAEATRAKHILRNRRRRTRAGLRVADASNAALIRRGTHRGGTWQAVA